MKTLIISLTLSTGMILSGCQSVPKVLTKEIYVAVQPPENLFDCPQIRKMDFPDPTKATNKEIADFLIKLYRYNKRCGNSQAAIKKYIAEVVKRIESRNK